MSEQAAENKALQLINWLTEKAIEGVPPLSSAEDLAQEYLIDQSYPDDERRIKSLINIVGKNAKRLFYRKGTSSP